jgi:hypothetical protein
MMIYRIAGHVQLQSIIDGVMVDMENKEFFFLFGTLSWVT